MSTDSDAKARSNAVPIRLTGVRKSFGVMDAVHIEDLQIRPSEFVTFVGPSGCGKTTTMRMIAGLEDPTAGTIAFGSRAVNDLPVQKRNVAMVFQNYALYPHMSVAANLEYGLKKRGVAPDVRTRQVDWVAKLLRIEKLLQRKPRELSGGEQQRVALGRAIIRTPDVLLLDEPLSNLDAKLRTFMRAELVKLQRQVGCTTIFVTHDQLEAMTMSDRIVVIYQGRVQQFAEPAEIYNNPANLFVAGFIGSPPMNLLEGELSAEGDDYVFATQDSRIRLSQSEVGQLRLPTDRKVTLGIRPEDISPEGQAPDVQGNVSLVELIGAEKYVFVDSALGTMIVRQRADAPVRAGDSWSARFARNKVRLFSTTDGTSLRLPG